MDDRLLALKTDPITFASDEIGWYAVQVNANDIATTGAQPRWMLVTLLLPEAQTTTESIHKITSQIQSACQKIGVTVVGGHTEITYGIDRPLVIGTMIGEVARHKLITPRGMMPGDRLLLTKGAPIEATAILARELPEKLLRKPETQPESKHLHELYLSQSELEQAQNYLYQPGISVLKDATIATQAGQVNAMHDPTEGGLYNALWEMAEASRCSLWYKPNATPIPELAKRICQILEIDPLGAIASGALLIAAQPDSAEGIRLALAAAGILCVEIGGALERNDRPSVQQGQKPDAPRLPRPARDEIARIFES